MTQVPTKTYAGLYTFPSVYGHLVVGPTKIIQDSKEDRGCSVESQALLESHILNFFPSLKGHINIHFGVFKAWFQKCVL